MTERSAHLSGFSRSSSGSVSGDSAGSSPASFPGSASVAPAAGHRRLGGHPQQWLDACRFVLVSPSLNANIGAAVRAMTTMGLSDLVVAAPRDPDFHADPAVHALAAGAQARVARVGRRDSLEAALTDCQLAVAVSAEGREFGPPPEFPGPLCAQVLDELAAGRLARVAFVFGTERTGLSVDEMRRCQRWLTIPADAAYSSLNLAQAVQIVAFSLRQAVLAREQDSAGERAGEAGGEPLASLGAVEGLLLHLERSLTALGTLDPARPRRLMPRLRQLLGRAQPTAPEVDLLRGICRDIDRVTGREAAPSPRQTT